MKTLATILALSTVMRFEKNLGSRTYNILDGLYSADLGSCSNGGLISGYQTK